MASLIGKVLGGCRVERLVGRGAVGEVYAGIQMSLNRPVAIKVLHHDAADGGGEKTRTISRGSLASFFAEARSIAKLSHPNVVQVHDTGNEAGISYIIMELVDGRTMRDFIRESFTPTTELAVMVMRQAAVGVNAAHEMGIIHRDIKPSNILVGNDWEVKVADFGLATPVGDHASNKLVVGTPAYMSPEQCRGEGVSKLSDIYSLGATFYHFLTGQLPFDDDDTMELMRKHVFTKLQPLREVKPDISIPLARVIERMMAKDTSQRCRSLAEAVQDLDRVHRTAAIEQAKIRAGGSRDGSVTTARAPVEGRAQAAPATAAKPRAPVMRAPRRSVKMQLALALLLVLTSMGIGMIVGNRLTWGGPDTATLSILVKSRCKRRDYEEARRLLTRRIEESSQQTAWFRDELARVVGEARTKVQDEIINVRDLREKGEIPAALVALDLLEHRFKGAGVDMMVTSLRKQLESARESRRAAWTEADLAPALARARQLKQDEQTTEAMVQYEDVVAVTRRFAQRPEIREATQELARLKRLDREARDFYLSGLALDRTLQTETALEMLQRATERLPGSVWARLAGDLHEVVSDRHWLAKTLYQRGEKSIDAGQRRDAIVQFEKIVSEYPDTSFARKARERLQDL